jgi:NADH:ubiquinone oxidoreductase subunit F (NADH-binding)
MSATAASLAGPAIAPGALPRLLAGVRADGPVPLDEHHRRYGELPRWTTRVAGAELLQAVEASGLQGRGGAAFPTGRKLRAVADRGRAAVVVANGAEGEPISRKDQVLLRHVPHLVLDGAAAAAAAVGARKAIFVVSARADAALATLGHAVAERVRRRLDHVAIEIAPIPDRFIAGEETAIVGWLNGGQVKPAFTPPRPFERGVRGAPTLVQNVETLAHIALIARFGPAWFRAVGTAAEPGSALVTLTGAVARPGIYEIPLGLPLRELVAWAGGPAQPIGAFLLGGYSGAWVAAAEGATLGLADAELSAAGAMLGARAIFALPEEACGIRETARVARYLATESAGQCGPCVHGLGAIAAELEAHASTTGRPRRRDERLERWLELVKGRGACSHPDGAARLVESALRVFAAESERHARGACSSDGRVALPVPDGGPPVR